MATTRIRITAKDIQVVTGFNLQYCYRLHLTIRDALGKKENQHLSIREFCNYCGYAENEVKEVII